MILVVLVRSAERERLVRVLDGDAERCDERDDGRGNEFRPSFILNFTLNIFLFFCSLCHAALRCTRRFVFTCALLHSINCINVNFSLCVFTDSCHRVNESISFERVAEQQERVH